MKLLIPGYIYPGAPPRTEWSQWIAAAREVSGIIANPGSPGGPGTFTDSNYAAVIAAAQNAGIRIWGYCDTNYSRPDVSVPVVDDCTGGGGLQAFTSRTGWGATIFWPGEPSMFTNAGSTATAPSGGGFIGNWRDTGAADHDFAVRFNVSGGTNFIYCRVSGQGTGSINGYALEWIPSTGVWVLSKVVANAFTTLASGTWSGTAPGNGEGLAIRAIGSRIEAWYQPPASAWTMLAAASDSTWTSQTVVGLDFNAGGQTIDQFRAGPIAQSIVTQIGLWSTLYGISDIFFDQVTADLGQLYYYTALCNYVRSLVGTAKTFLNHGIDADIGYSTICDLNCTFEGPFSSYASYEPSQAWEKSVPADHICHLVYSCGSSADVRKVFSQARMQNVGHLRAADSNSWFVQNAFWPDEVQGVDNTLVPRTLAGWGVKSG